MSLPWYAWRPVQTRLIRFGRALQGLHPYRVRLEPDRARCPSGYCDLGRREIVVNPALFEAPDGTQYELTKALLVHEAGHRRFTTPQSVPPIVHRVANMLEDERVERAMCARYAGVRWLVHRLAEAIYARCQPVDGDSDSPGQLLAYLLQHRWAIRLGEAVKGTLSAHNRTLWAEIEPLVHEAWEAPTTETVYRNAARIVDLLSLREDDVPDWVHALSEQLGTPRGVRRADDGAVTADTEGGALLPHLKGDPTPFDGHVPPNDQDEGEGKTAIEPQPYVDLEERVQPLVRELIAALSLEHAAPPPEPAERGARLSVRQYVRDRARPFLTVEDDRPAPPTVRVLVLVDHSTSMNNRSDGQLRVQSVAEAVMAVHLVCLELGMVHEVWVMPQDIKLTDNESGERGKALIAGLVPALCDYEDLGRALQTHALPLATDDHDLKLVLCLTDGACNDEELAREICRQLRGRVEVLGLLLDPEEETRHYVAAIFGADRLIACRAPELPRKLGDILRALRGA